MIHFSSGERAVGFQPSALETSERKGGLVLRVPAFRMNSRLGAVLLAVLFWESSYLGNPTPSPSLSWNHEVSGKWAAISWGSVSYGKILEGVGFESTVHPGRVRCGMISQMWRG
jgi:hypothetical protein